MNLRPVLPFLLVLLSVVVLAPFVGGGFVTDDFVHVARLQERLSFADTVSSPDAFGLYRPVTQASLRLDRLMWGLDAAAFRRTNLLLHTLVLLCAFTLARKLLDSTHAAALATLAFLLTPKAHPIAVLWISGRSDLLMSLFSLLALLCWMQWETGGPRDRWCLAGAALCYGFAVLSKEAAVLLPALLLLAPRAAAVPRRRLAACVPMLIVAGGALALRVAAGALMPASGDEHYNLATPAVLWGRNLANYVPRAIPSPLALVALVGVSLVLRRATAGQRPLWPAPRPKTAALAAYAAAWFAVFMVPVLGIAARSELYLYLPVLGACVLAAHLVVPLAAGDRRGRLLFALMTFVYVGAFAGYQVSRSALMHETALFSARLVEALSSSDALRTYRGRVLLRAADAATESHLRNAVGGYFSVVLRLALGAPPGRPEVGGQTSYDPPAAGSYETVLVCAYRDGQVTLRRIE